MNTRNWRTPAMILLCGGMALTIAIGARQNMGLYLHPMTTDLGMSRQTFSFAIAIQNLFYGFAQPFSGMIADRFGAARVMSAGALFYALGLALMAHSTTGWELGLSAGVLIGTAASRSRGHQRVARPHDSRSTRCECSNHYAGVSRFQRRNRSNVSRTCSAVSAGSSASGTATTPFPRFLSCT